MVGQFMVHELSGNMGILLGGITTYFLIKPKVDAPRADKVESQ